MGSRCHDCRVAEEFEFRDLSGAAFWGVNLEGATFRDVDLTGARFSHSRLADVVIDAEIDRLVVNGVDATGKWFTVPILGRTFHPIGMPNSGSVDFGWPGIDATATPTFDDATAAWRERSRQLRQYIDDVEPAALTATVDVLENGTTPVLDCIGVVFEEHFEHLRYALRDLDRLG